MDANGDAQGKGWGLTHSLFHFDFFSGFSTPKVVVFLFVFLSTTKKGSNSKKITYIGLVSFGFPPSGAGLLPLRLSG